jgi:YesN/AraC family two-component response regulator
LELKTDSPPSISILFVEDDELILELQSSVLAMKFPDVMLYTAVNGSLGLELFKKYTPAIVITDINMTEMCGLQMAENVRALTTDTKIIAITGRDSDEIRHAFDRIITKPVDLSELFAVVDQCIGEIEQRRS